MTTDALLLTGSGGSVVFIAVLIVEGARRPGYDPIYHTGSELELGERGWVQRTNFVVMAGAVFALALGVHRTLGTVLGATLLTVFGVGMLAAGALVPDAIRGYPPGAPRGVATKPTWRHVVHGIVSGPVAFLAILAACLVLATHLDGAWRGYTLLTAGAGFAMTVWTAIAYQKDAGYTGLVQRGLILVYWSWLAILGAHLVARSTA